jgi:hypothetical protein
VEKGMEFTNNLWKGNTLSKQGIREIVPSTYEEGGMFSEDGSM